MRHPDKGPARHIHGLEETIAANVDHTTVQRLLRREGNRAQQNVKLTPLLLNPLKHLLRLSLEIDVERHENWRMKLLRKRFDIWPGTLVKIGHSDIGAQGAQSACASPGDRVFVGNADDQRLLAFEGDLSFRKDRNVHDTLSRPAFERLDQSTDNVCSAII